MTIQFLNTGDDPRKVSKSWQAIKTVTAQIYDDCTAEDPNFLIEFDNNILTNANYMYVPDFGRYYFINTMDVQEGSRMTIHGHVDVLQTYHAQILNLTCVIARQENSGLTLVPDTNITEQNYNPIDIYNSPFTFDISIGSYVLQVLGGI